MRENQMLLPEPQHNFWGFLKNLFYRYQYGDTPSEYTPPGYVDNIRLTDLAFDSHPGPINSAIEDAINMHKSLFLYIYFTDNETCLVTDELFKLPTISDEIQRSFVFYPVNITSFDGYNLANKFNFKKLPIFALIRPRGHSLHESTIFLNHEGFITETGLLSYLTLEHPQDSEIINAQDTEFMEAVAAAEQNNMTIQQIENEAREAEARQEQEKKDIEEKFNQIPKPHQNEQCYTIKFHFPDNNERMRSFPINGTLAMLYTFARYYMFPDVFALKAGYPLNEIPDNSDPISSISTAKMFIIYVDSED
ncbi:hypothetical protein TRFO_18964 [Tritrichomonas foetus]|uniref:UBX domain-containing protein n=1 Tax=Tritrichomonas foetus TaxID=1144522 RepID=A0A1J4KKR0_9EUKA|nr:hypothetical protein TRFO_18964 [Tritrichomonas foetus]|eukprot:OHT11520.1 hypothetical protein TRFO_18964 [Tritrichomonas foetus]